MTFELLPVMDIMFHLYQKPRTPGRFQEYLKTLQGHTKGNLALPITGFNPMAKEHALEKLTELKQLSAEQVITRALMELNTKLSGWKIKSTFKVAFNLCDDLKGGWTNSFTSDYDSKFKINALIKRNFCVPVFWTSETYNTKKVMERTLEYCNRTIYWLSHPRPKTLEEHILQEVAVARDVKTDTQSDFDIKTLKAFYQANKDSTDYVTIFNFLYGDTATASLGNNTLGIKERFAGYRFAKWLASR